MRCYLNGCRKGFKLWFVGFFMVEKKKKRIIKNVAKKNVKKKRVTKPKKGSGLSYGY